jgi:carbon storage regulator CsrA
MHHFQEFHMLVLSRKEGESVRVGDAVVTVTKIGIGGVKLGFAAPQTTKIVRTELEGRPRRPAA